MKKIKKIRELLLIGSAIFLVACAADENINDSTLSNDDDVPPSTKRYHIENDVIPKGAPDIGAIENATPRYEPYTKYGNSKYTVMNKEYTVRRDVKNFVQRGQASWYGSKFHGYLTSIGETYDMYSMSAAHKTLPLPSYVRVTNLANNKQVIVRVNDRGPFHSGRIIDLSYAAASKLDMLSKGVANVRLEVITVDKRGNIYYPSSKTKTKEKVVKNPSTENSTLKSSKNIKATYPYYVQVISGKDKKKIDEMASSLKLKNALKINVLKVGDLYKVQALAIDEVQAGIIKNKLIKAGYKTSFIVKQTN